MKYKTWILAARPKVLTASFVPVLVGTALAHQAGYPIHWVISLCALLSACCIQIGMHFVNDALDFQKGVDTSNRLGPTRVTQKGLLPMRQVYFVGLFMLGMALVFGIPLMVKGKLPITCLLFVSVALGYLYTGGPKPISYSGYSELFVLLFYGLASTIGVYYLQTEQISQAAVTAGLQIGSLAVVVNAINNLRDIVGDAKANKNTFAVQFGIKFARGEIALALLTPFFLSAVWWDQGYTSAALLPTCTLPIAIHLIKNIWNTPPSSQYNAYFVKAALLHLLFGILLALALWFI